MNGRAAILGHKSDDSVTFVFAFDNQLPYGQLRGIELAPVSVGGLHKYVLMRGPAVKSENAHTVARCEGDKCGVAVDDNRQFLPLLKLYHRSVGSDLIVGGADIGYQCREHYYEEYAANAGISMSHS